MPNRRGGSYETLAATRRLGDCVVKCIRLSTHSLFVDAPPLNDERLIIKGAGHYDLGCRACHGSPEYKSPVIAQQMTPHPPYLGPLIAKWDTEELFHLVKHGVKLTGMPAWPALQRDDEVRGVVLLYCACRT